MFPSDTPSIIRKWRNKTKSQQQQLKLSWTILTVRYTQFLDHLLRQNHIYSAARIQTICFNELWVFFLSKNYNFDRRQCISLIVYDLNCNVYIQSQSGPLNFSVRIRMNVENKCYSLNIFTSYAPGHGRVDFAISVWKSQTCFERAWERCGKMGLTIFHKRYLCVTNCLQKFLAEGSAI